MRTDIYLLLTFDIRTEKFDTLTALVQVLAQRSAEEDGCLAYEFSADTDRSKAYMVEHFRSSASLVDHIKHGFSQYADEWNSMLSLSSMVVIGEPSDELRNLLPSEAVYVDRIGGFIR